MIIGFIDFPGLYYLFEDGLLVTLGPYFSWNLLPSCAICVLTQTSTIGVVLYTCEVPGSTSWSLPSHKFVRGSSSIYNPYLKHNKKRTINAERMLVLFLSLYEPISLSLSLHI